MVTQEDRVSGCAKDIASQESEKDISKQGLRTDLRKE